jgi:branched-subunit amino acid transport protein AzlD
VDVVEEEFSKPTLLDDGGASEVWPPFWEMGKGRPPLPKMLNKLEKELGGALLLLLLLPMSCVTSDHKLLLQSFCLQLLL